MAETTSFLGGALKRTELFGDEQVESLLAASRSTGQNITEIVARDGYAQEEDFLESLGRVLDIPFVRLRGVDIEEDVLLSLPTKAVFQYNVVPMASENGVLQVACNDPFNAALLDALRVASGMRVRRRPRGPWACSHPRRRRYSRSLRASRRLPC